MRPTWVDIDLAALRHNLSVVKMLAPYQKVMAVIKANGYGHGILPVADVLQHEIDAFAVTSVDEAMLLREHGVVCPLVLLEGFFDKSELPFIEQYGLEPVLHCAEQVQELLSCSLAHPINIWLKFDSGMHRLGFEPDDYARVYHQLLDCPHVAHIGHMSHFARADDVRHGFTVKQLRSFKQVSDDLEGLTSLANSAGILAWPESHGDWVRPGIMLYGISPLLQKHGVMHGLKPVMTFRSQLIAIRQVIEGEGIGYSGTWSASEPVYIGTVAVGYGDGYPRHAPSGTPVLINGQTYPLVGRVSMDMITVNLGRTLQAKLGDEVVLWGEGLPVEVIAEHAQTIGYELLCGITERVRRCFQA